jgi:hypothetical protein
MIGAGGQCPVSIDPRPAGVYRFQAENSLTFRRSCLVDFIERLFGMSPDGGNGLFEVSFILVLIAAVGLVIRKTGQGRD